MFDSLFKAALNVIAVPVAVVADVVTLGGVLTDRDTNNSSYTMEQLEKAKNNFDKATR